MRTTRVYFSIAFTGAIHSLVGCGAIGSIKFGEESNRNQSQSASSVVLQFSPQLVPIGGLLTVTGTDFSNTQTLMVGGQKAIILSQSSSTLMGMVMPGSISGIVSIENSDGKVFTSTDVYTKTSVGFPSVQQGSKLVGTGVTGATSRQGNSVSISADGNTVLVGGPYDNSFRGATWVFARSGGVWTQQGSKLVGTGAVGNAWQGASVALSSDGNTALIGGKSDGTYGASWVFTRSGGIWTQQGSKLVGTGMGGATASQGQSVALSADGNTALVGSDIDGPSGGTGAAWVFIRSGGVWSQQGPKLVGTGRVEPTFHGYSVALSADGNTALIGGPPDDSDQGAAWVFTRSGGGWTQQGSKLVGTGAVGAAKQGSSVALSGDGNTAIVGGPDDNSFQGAFWVYTRSGGVWTQQGPKLVGTGGVGNSTLGYSVSLSVDGNTAFVGGREDDGNGAVWVFTRSGGVWTQQGSKLVGSGAVNSWQGSSVSLSADGSIGVVGGHRDSVNIGAAWIWGP